MQLSEIRVEGDWSFHLSLHPLVTVVTGLGRSRRAELAAILADALRGQPTPGCVVLAAGDPPTLVTRNEIERLEIPASIDVRLGAADLPGAVVKEPTTVEDPDDHSDDAPAGAPIDPEVRDEVANALRQLDAVRSAPGGPSPEAQQLRREWDQLLGEWQRAHVDDGGSDHLTRLRRRLEKARLDLAAAEQYARPLVVDGDFQARLDEAHRRVEEAEERLARRLSGGAARRRLEAARAVEIGLLQQVGLGSYDAYLLRTSSGLGDLLADERLGNARRVLAEAEAEWELASLNEPTDVRELRRRRDSLLYRAGLLVGREVTEADVAETLDSAQTPRSDHDALLHLQAALDRAGVAVHETLENEARAWLEEVAEKGAVAIRIPHRRPVSAVEADVSGVDADEAQVYVLARIASQRLVGQAGSLPLVLDEPFADLPAHATKAMLGTLQRLAPAIQVIYLSDDEDVVTWGAQLPREMGAVRHFSAG